MMLESAVRTDPERRADRFVETGQRIASDRAKAERIGDRAGVERATGSMGQVAAGLHRDPQLESVLRRRAPS